MTLRGACGGRPGCRRRAGAALKVMLVAQVRGRAALLCGLVLKLGGGGGGR